MGELRKKEKDKYNEKFKEHNMKYRGDLEKVQYLIFKDFNDVVYRLPTVYRILGIVKQVLAIKIETSKLVYDEQL